MLVSFDFDETLCYNFINEVAPNIESIEMAKNHYENGDELIIVTSRRSSKENLDFINSFLKKFDINYLFGKIYMVGEIKARHLKDLGVSLHYDDKDAECSQARLLGVKCTKVR